MGRARNKAAATVSSRASRRIVTPGDIELPLLLAHRDDDRVATQRQVMMDVDSTVWPLLHAMADRPGGARVSYENCPTWRGLADLVDGGVPRMLEIFDECFTYESMSRTGMFPGAVEGMLNMHRHGVPLHFMTLRPPEFHDDVRQFLDDHAVPVASLQCGLDIDKVAHCQELGITTLVDDHPDLLDEAHAVGLNALALEFPFNRDALRRNKQRRSRDWTDLTRNTLTTVQTEVQAALADLNEPNPATS